MQEPAPAKAGEIDERVHAFLDRPLAGEWRYLLPSPKLRFVKHPVRQF
jgi:hypothetical protein